MPELPFIPENITVHLGPASSNAENVTVSFPDYIKNVASSEIYPTWPENALRANIYAQISFALNRIYTEYYRSRGYDFDITSSTASDQYFVNGRDIFENISQIVDEIFNDYISVQGKVEPLFAQYCDGVSVTCSGLSQWGSVDLAEKGYTPYEILKYYYGDDIDIVRNAPISGITDTLPPIPLKTGSFGEDVRTLQIRLNRIGQNYPSIPKIYPIDGFFTDTTEEAVKRFQQIFNLDTDGIVGKATWYKIRLIYNSVKKLNELDSEGLSLDEVSRELPYALRVGDTGDSVKIVQYYLDGVAEYDDRIPPIAVDGIYGPATESAVRAFQETRGLGVDGIVGEETWLSLYATFIDYLSTTPPPLYESGTQPFSGRFLFLGVSGDDVSYLQTYLNEISTVYTEIPKTEVTGLFGTKTRDAVVAFQRIFGFETNGVVGPLVWDKIAEVYSDIVNGELLGEGQYPGYELKVES